VLHVAPRLDQAAQQEVRKDDRRHELHGLELGACLVAASLDTPVNVHASVSAAAAAA